MGIAQGELQNLSLGLGLETDADEFLLDFVSFRYAHDHIVNQGAIQPVHRAMAGLVGRAGYGQLISLYGHGNIRVNLLAELSQRSFHAYHVPGADGNRHPGGQVYR